MFLFFLIEIITSIRIVPGYGRQRNKEVYYGTNYFSCNESFMTKVYQRSQKWETIVQNITFKPMFDQEEFYKMSRKKDGSTIEIRCSVFNPECTFPSILIPDTLSFCQNVEISDDDIEVYMLDIFASNLRLASSEEDKDSFFITKSTNFSQRDKDDWNRYYPLNKTFVFPKAVYATNTLKKKESLSSGLQNSFYFPFLFILFL